jgi:hypothetical protein
MYRTSTKILLIGIAMFAITSSNVVGSAFAWTVSNEYYSHEHATATTNHGLVCGDHPCCHGETPQHPKKADPVKGHV